MNARQIIDLTTVTDYQHRVRGEVPSALPCHHCQGRAVVVHHPELSFDYSVRCENIGRSSHRGGGSARYGKTERGAIAAWNRHQLPNRKRNYMLADDLEMAAPHCPRCGLRGEHECLHGDGYQREDRGEASRRVRLGG